MNLTAQPQPRVDAALVVFCRLPVEGRVKTRLAATIGHADACTFYKACAEHTLQVASSCDQVKVFVFHSHGDNTKQVQEWVHSVTGRALEVRCQAASPNLGDKMAEAMGWALETSGCRKVLIIGTDIPDMATAVLQKALHALETFEVVVGPAVDGGFYLLGLSRVPANMFQGIVWSTSSVLQDTLARGAELGLDAAPVDTLPLLRDIDTVQDLREWAQQRATTGGDTRMPELAVNCFAIGSQLQAAEQAHQDKLQALYKLALTLLSGQEVRRSCSQVK